MSPPRLFQLFNQSSESTDRSTFYDNGRYFLPDKIIKSRNFKVGETIRI
jgi:hypothetical protein